MSEKRLVSKKMYRSSDREAVFYEDEVEEAKKFFDAPENLSTLEEVADLYNDERMPVEECGSMIIEERFEVGDPDGDPENRYTLVSINDNGNIREFKA